MQISGKGKRVLVVVAILALALSSGVLVVSAFQSPAKAHSSPPISKATTRIVVQQPADTATSTAKQVESYGAKGAATFSELLQSVRSMTIELNFTSARNGTLVKSCEKFSFVASVGSLDDGSVAYRVNLTGTSISGNQVDKESSIAWVDPDDSSVLKVTMDGKVWMGANASSESHVLSLFTTDGMLSLLNSSAVTRVAAGQVVKLGDLKLSASTYQSLGTVSLAQDLRVTVGTIPQTGMQLVLSASYVVPGSGSTTFNVLSLALVQ